MPKQKKRNVQTLCFMQKQLKGDTNAKVMHTERTDFDLVEVERLYLVYSKTYFISNCVEITAFQSGTCLRYN